MWLQEKGENFSLYFCQVLNRRYGVKQRKKDYHVPINDALFPLTVLIFMSTFPSKVKKKTKKKLFCLKTEYKYMFCENKCCN